MAYFLVATFILAPACVSAESNLKENAVIKLKDGAVIVGRVLGQEGDRYRIMTGTMGIVTVREADIESMQDDKGMVWEKYQKAIVEDPQTIASIQGLGQDEEIIKIVSDPQIRDAVARQDLEYLRTNEKFLKFMNNPTVKEIIRNTQDTVESQSK
jgi:hypothetical protein